MKALSLLTGLLFTINLLSAQTPENLINLNKASLYNKSFDIKTNYWTNSGNSSNPSLDEPAMFTWQSVQTPVSASITAIYFNDSLNGWACHTSMGGLRTTNSGFNWDVISFNDTTFTTLFNSTYFINALTGWMVGGALQIRKTTNGGMNWFRQNVPPIAGILHSVYFINENTGYAAGSKNYPYVPCIIKSTNGGTTWTEITPLSTGQELNCQYWFNANTGWFCGYDFLMKTTNSGVNFTNYFPNLPPTANGHSVILSISWVNEQTGWVGAANLERNNIYKTTNGGTNWVFQDNPVSQNGWNQMNDIKFISIDSGWAAHGTPTSGAIMFTSNGGANWLMDNTQNYWYMCLAKFQKAKLWSGSSGGKVWWTLIQEPVGISTNEQIEPKEFKLFQNYPNPFNPTTVISYKLVVNSYTKLVVYDILGHEIATLVNEQLKPGTYEVEFDGRNYSSGVYYYKLIMGDYVQTRKMVLLK
jgi:photosystem II stability/assembly factor-like uncharacterized protein